MICDHILYLAACIMESARPKVLIPMMAKVCLQSRIAYIVYGQWSQNIPIIHRLCGYRHHYGWRLCAGIGFTHALSYCSLCVLIRTIIIVDGRSYIAQSLRNATIAKARYFRSFSQFIGKNVFLAVRQPVFAR